MQTSILTPQDIFFKIVRYEVPVFQRPYIWTKDDQWEPLWEDVSDMAEAVIENGEAGRHFMGAIVLQQRLNPIQGIETRIVVDGQQRLTTLQLLIDAVQEVFERDGYQGPAVRLDSLVNTPEAFRGNNPDLAYKVWPTTFDQAAFRHAMSNELSSDAYKNSRIVAAHDYFKNKTEQWLSAFPEDDGRRNAAADALDSAIRNYLELVVIELGSSDDPHVIFETLNARGTPLLPSDMIKNQILHKAGVMGEDGGDPEATAADRLWPFAGDWWRDEIGRGHQRRPRIDVYLNNWLTLRNQSETKANNEFATFNDYVEAAEENGETVRDIAADIGRLGEIYSQIDQRSLPDIEPFLYRRQVMGVGVVIPALLWLLSSEVPRHQLLKSLTALESYLVRRMACGMSARSYGQLFIGLVAELDKAGPDHAGEATVQYLGRQTAFANQWPDDQTLLDTFVSEPLYWSLTAGRLNLILQGIEGDLRTAWAESQSVPRDLHIEHVMPQGWQSDRWPLPINDDEDATMARRNRLIHSIGNLTLVNQRLNSALSNAPWHDKRKTLDRHTVLFLNKDLLANAPSGWDETTIADRGKRLHQTAVRVWPHAASIH
jgi:hypothetical protein